jgi:glycosyltransferase involved in cell wall biosynthesis
MYELGKRLNEKGYDINFVVGDCGQKSIEDFDGIKVYRQKLVNSRWLKIRGMWYLYQFLYFLLVRKIKADIYVINGATPDTFLQAFYTTVIKSKFVYMTASDVDADGRYKKMHKEQGRLYEKGLKMTDLIICQNKSQQNEMEKNYHLKSEFITNSIKIPKEPASVDSKKSILWVGTSRPLKQPEVFLRIIEKYSQYHFTMIMPKHDENKWNEIFEKTKNYSNLEFIERVPFEKIGEYFQKSKLFINTSIYEGFPVTFLQAAVCATPVLTLNVNPDNFLSEHACGYCAQGSEENLMKKVDEFMSDERLWKENSDNIFRFVKENHDIDHNIVKFEEYINEVLKK